MRVLVRAGKVHFHEASGHTCFKQGLPCCGWPPLHLAGSQRKGTAVPRAHDAWFATVTDRPLVQAAALELALVKGAGKVAADVGQHTDVTALAENEQWESGHHALVKLPLRQV